MDGSPLVFNQPGAWNRAKVDAFKAAFSEFLRHVRINSKEKGGNYCIADGVYEAQRRFLAAVYNALADDVHDIKILKSRQLGCSTISKALVVFYIGIFKGIQGAAILDTHTHMQEARRDIEWMLDNLPASLGFPRIKERNRDGITLFNGSSLRFLSAGIRNSRGGGTLTRGSGLNLLWASEICSWENAEGLATMKSSLAKDFPDRLYLWESTARSYNDWHTMWLEAKADDLNQRAEFIGWWAKQNQAIARGTAHFARYGEALPTEDEQKRIDKVEAQYGFSVSREQLAWYRQLTDPAREREAGDPDDSLLLQDQPWDEEEAFQQSGSTFFDPEVLSAASAKVPSFKPQGFKFYPATEFVHSDFRLARTYRDVELRVWEEPEAEACYVIAGDPAFGHDETNDRSACQVLKCYADGIEQVAEYASASAPAHQFAWLIAGLVGWYAQGGRAQVLVIIELNGPGEAVWREYSGLRQIVSNGYLRKEAAEKGLRDVFNNVRNYVYARSDSMTGGHNYHFKPLGIRTLLPTAKGWTTMGDVAVGDTLFDERGQPTKVVFCSPVMLGHPCYRLTFDDGSQITADAEHPWPIADGDLTETKDLVVGQAIQCAAPLQAPITRLPVEPYTLGVWLGDGTSAAGAVSAGDGDAVELTKLLRERGWPVVPRKYGDKVWRLAVPGLQTALKSAGVFGRKHIPREYLRASHPQRLALLQGLMDTDGSINADRQCEFVTSNPRLRDDFAELLRTLGIKAKFLIKHPELIYQGNLVACAEAYQFWFTGYPDLPVFRLRRKAERLAMQPRPGLGIGKGAPGRPRFVRSRRHKIVSIEPVASVPVRCIAVDSPSHLFLAGEAMVPTHNTNQQLKVAIMERLRDFTHSGKLLVRSMDTIEEMKAITRAGDTIKGEGKKKDDRVFAMALGCRAWEEKLRRGLIAGNRTKEADIARKRLSYEDRYKVFTRSTLDMFFKSKERDRMALSRQATRNGWRYR